MKYPVSLCGLRRLHLPQCDWRSLVKCWLTLVCSLGSSVITHSSNIPLLATCSSGLGFKLRISPFTGCLPTGVPAIMLSLVLQCSGSTFIPHSHIDQASRLPAISVLFFNKREKIRPKRLEMLKQRAMCLPGGQNMPSPSLKFFCSQPVPP